MLLDIHPASRDDQRILSHVLKGLDTCIHCKHEDCSRKNGKENNEGVVLENDDNNKKEAYYI